MLSSPGPEPLRTGKPTIASVQSMIFRERRAKCNEVQCANGDFVLCSPASSSLPTCTGGQVKRVKPLVLLRFARPRGRKLRFGTEWSPPKESAKKSADCADFYLRQYSLLPILRTFYVFPLARFACRHEHIGTFIVTDFAFDLFLKTSAQE